MLLILLLEFFPLIVMGTYSVNYIYIYIYKDRYNMLLILLLQFFPPIVLSILCMEKCQLSYKTLKKLKKFLFGYWMFDSPLKKKLSN